jgi:hypothetical protein
MRRLHFTFLLIALALTLGSQPSRAQWIINGRWVCTAPDHQFKPTLISDGNGGAIAAWQDFRNGTNNDIYAQHILSTGVVDGAWPPNGRALSLAVGKQVFPRVISDGAGGAIATWEDYRGASTDIYAQHVLGTGEVDPKWPINGGAVCTAAGNQRYPRIVSDGAGGAIITWDDYRDGNADIYAQHILSTGGVDPGWPADGRALCTAADDQNGSWQSFTIVRDGAGGAIVTWEDHRNGSSYDIYAQHIMSSGVLDSAWPVNGCALCTDPGNQVGPAIVSDEAGGAIVTWQDFRGGKYDIYAQHVTSTGAVDGAWPVDGRVLCSPPGAGELNPAIVSDGSGGAIVSWHDFRSANASNDGIYAQHVLSAGSVDGTWPVDGRALCTATGAGGKLDPTMIMDDAGGAIVTWWDYRSGNADIYAQHVLSTGGVDPAWIANGVLLCKATNSLPTVGPDALPAIVSDGSGGAIVTWEDGRSELGYDIYAQRVYGGGGVAAVSPGRVQQFSVRAPHPNPAHAGTTISFDLPAAQRLSVGVYDVSGQLIRTLAAAREFPVGSQQLIWNGTSDAGALVSAGIYFIRATAADGSVTRRVAILR